MNEPRTTDGQIVLIGSTRRREFELLIRWLRSQTTIVAEFPSIDTALQATESITSTDLTIVLQSHSDQFLPGSVNHLIGATLFSRLLCCFAPACESDGRNRDVWPDAVRVPLRLAPSIIQRELRGAASGEPALPPTAGRDEVFAHRLGRPEDWQPPEALQTMNGAVISPDQVLRRTVTAALKQIGLKALDLPLVTVSGARRIRPKETSRGPVHLLIHDLDPWGDLVSASLIACRQMFPSAFVVGLGTMPDAGLATEIADVPLAAVIPKLDMEHGLNWHLTQLVKSRSSRVLKAATPDRVS